MRHEDSDNRALYASVNEHRAKEDKKKPFTAVEHFRAQGWDFSYGIKKTLLIMPKGKPGYLYNCHNARWYRVGQDRTFKGSGIERLIKHVLELPIHELKVWRELGLEDGYRQLVLAGSL